jgi:signal transduction histidine kinase/CheY-like chemotaxis protein
MPITLCAEILSANDKLSRFYMEGAIKCEWRIGARLPGHANQRIPANRNREFFLLKQAAQICTVVACLVPSILLAQGQAGWRFWDVSSGMVESYSLAVGKGPDGRVWVRHGAVKSMSVLDGYSIQNIPEPRLGSIADFRSHQSVRRVYGGSGPDGWTTESGALKQFDGKTWTVRLPETPGQQLLAAVPLAGKVLLLYPDRLAEFDPASGSVVIVKRSRDTSIGEFRDIVAGFESEILIAGATGIARMAAASPGGSLHWTQCNTSAAGLRDLEHLLPGDAGEIFFSGTLGKSSGQETSAAAVWDAARDSGVKILYRNPQESVRVWRGPDHSLWLLQGSSLFQVVSGRKEPVARRGPLSGTVLDILTEPGGAFWLGSSDGLAHYTPPTWRTPPEVSGLSEPISKMTQDAKGRLWFVGSRHLIELDGAAWTIRALPSNLLDGTTQIEGLCMLPDERLAMMAEESGKDDRLLIFDTRRGTFQKILHPGGRSISFFSCRAEGGLWVTTSPGMRLETFDGRDFHAVADLSGEWSGGAPRKIIERGPGEFLIGGNAGAGILRQGHFHPFGPEDGFTENGALSMIDTGSEILASGRQDLLSYDGRRWTNVAKRLAPRVARKMRDGTMWVASFTGIHRFREGVWITNTESDGLPSDRVRNVLEDRDGRIWVGTSNGLSLYHPDADRVAPRTMLALTDNPKEVVPGGNVQIHFAGADQWQRTNPDQLLFAFSLDDRPWHPFAAANQATFEALPAGPHHLQVRAMDRNGNAESGGDALDFVVLLPWYRHPDFLILTAAGSMLILGLLWLARANYRKLAHLVVQLDGARIAAESASRFKTEFLANMSHEIRTPMNGIIGMAELAREAESREEQREYLEMVTMSGNALLTVINDILDFSKIEAGKMELDPIPFALRDTVFQALRALAIPAQQKGIELTFDIADDIPDVLVGDPDRLRQIILNLAGNALKFTERGEVDLQAGVTAHSGGSVTVEFSVRDTGIGIPPAKQAAVFAAFTQADGSTTRRFGGTGLGLTISKQLTALMGGKMWLESELGRGTTMYFTAVFGVPEGATREAATIAKHDLTGLRTLIIDDNATNRRILDVVLRKQRLSTVVAESGAHALAVIEQQPFDLILLDAEMPAMDGFELAAQIRQRWPDFTARIVMLSSLAHQPSAARRRDLRIAACLSKPIRNADLIDTLQRLFGGGAAQGVPPALQPDEPSEARRHLNVLVAEDNAVNQALVRKILTKRGHTVVMAGDGRAAVDAFLRERFDVILMDVQMPEMDGVEATAAIRGLEKHGIPKASSSELEHRERVPIIALTAHAMTGDREKFLAAGMDGYVTKPIQAAALCAAMAEVCGFQPAL